jgi:hypothetical protein
MSPLIPLSTKLQQDLINQQGHFIIDKHHTLDLIEVVFNDALNNLSEAQKLNCTGGTLPLKRFQEQVDKCKNQKVILTNAFLQAINAFETAGGDLENLANGIYPNDSSAQSVFLSKFQR